MKKMRGKERVREVKNVKQEVRKISKEGRLKKGCLEWQTIMIDWCRICMGTV